MGPWLRPRGRGPSTSRESDSTRIRPCTTWSERPNRPRASYCGSPRRVSEANDSQRGDRPERARRRLADLAARGVVASVQGKDGEDFLGPAVDAARAVLRGAVAEERRASAGRPECRVRERPRFDAAKRRRRDSPQRGRARAVDGRLGGLRRGPRPRVAATSGHQPRSVLVGGCRHPKITETARLNRRQRRPHDRPLLNRAHCGAALRARHRDRWPRTSKNRATHDLRRSQGTWPRPRRRALRRILRTHERSPPHCPSRAGECC